eukprot:scaffold3762_cov118-Isochrysis_galbana.AAC.15
MGASGTGVGRALHLQRRAPSRHQLDSVAVVAGDEYSPVPRPNCHAHRSVKRAWKQTATCAQADPTRPEAFLAGTTGTNGAVTVVRNTVCLALSISPMIIPRPREGTRAWPTVERSPMG